MTEEQYRVQYDEDDAVGWDAIDAALETLYGDLEPRHYASIVKYATGGEDPLDGTSIYDCDEQTFHRHLVSYGMSELYFDPESADAEYSGWGFEFTMRIAPCAEDQACNGAEHEPVWVINLMNNLARYVFKSENWFEPYHFITANGPIRADTDTALVGLALVPDPKLPTIVRGLPLSCPLSSTHTVVLPCMGAAACCPSVRCVCVLWQAASRSMVPQAVMCIACFIIMPPDCFADAA